MPTNLQPTSQQTRPQDNGRRALARGARLALIGAGAGVLFFGTLLVVFLLVPPSGDGYHKLAQFKADNVARAVKAYIADHEGQRPATLDSLTQKDARGNGPYIGTEGLLDPWGKPFKIDCEGKHNGGTKPDVWTTSPDGKTLGNWRDP